MKKTLLIISLFALLGCGQIEEEKKRYNNPINGHEGMETIVVKDGCQYFKYEASNSSSSRVYSLTHKGNCNNPVHKCNCK